MGRVEVIPTDFLRVNYEYRNDNSNGTEHYGEIMVEIPFSIDNLIAGKNPFEGMGSHIGGNRTMDERMYEPVRRDVDIITDTTSISRWTHPGKVILGDPSEFYYGVYYATPGGAGAGTLYDPGSPANALASSAPTVFFLPGDYAGMTWNRGGANVFGMGFDPTLHTAIYNQTNLSGNSNFTSTFTVAASGIAVKGFNANLSSGIGIDIVGGNSYVMLENNILTTTGGYTIRIQPGCDHINMWGNTITNLYTGGGGNCVRAEDTDNLDIIGNTMKGLPNTSAMYVFGGDNINIGYNTIGANLPVERGIVFWEYGGTPTTNVSFFSNSVNAINYGFHVSNSGSGIANFSITNNVFNIAGATNSQGIRFWTGGGNYPLTNVNISGNTLNISSSGDAWAVMIYNSILTNVSITGNSGWVVGGLGNEVYFIRLDADGGHLNWGGIGTGPGQNDIGGTLMWNGNYPSTPGPVFRYSSYLGTLSP